MRTIHPKVEAAGIGSTVGGAVSLLIVWGLGAAGVQVPPEPAAAIGVLATAIVGLAAGYLRRGHV